MALVSKLSLRSQQAARFSSFCPMISVALMLRMSSWVPLTRSTISTALRFTEALSAMDRAEVGALRSSVESGVKPT